MLDEQKQRQRIARLLAKAESTNSEHEAEALRAKARELTDKLPKESPKPSQRELEKALLQEARKQFWVKKGAS